MSKAIGPSSLSASPAKNSTNFLLLTGSGLGDCRQRHSGIHDIRYPPGAFWLYNGG